MATKQSTTSQSKPEPEFKLYVQSNDPDTFGPLTWQGGIGTVVKSVYAPAMFSRESGKHALFHLVTIREEDGTEHLARYLRGFFGNTDKKPDSKKFIGNNTYPSKDRKWIAGPAGKTTEELLEEYADLAKGKDESGIPSIPEDEIEDYEGYYVVSMAETRGGNNDDRQLLNKVKAITQTDPADPSTSTVSFEEDSRFLCGHKFLWDRLPQEFTFKQKEGQEKRDYKILIPTQYFGLDEEWEAESQANGKTKEKKEAKPTTDTEEVEQSTDESEEDSFAEDLTMKIRSFLVKNKAKGPLDKKTVSTFVVNAYPEPEQKKMAIALWGNLKWSTHEDRPWTYEDGAWRP